MREKKEWEKKKKKVLGCRTLLFFYVCRRPKTQTVISKEVTQIIHWLPQRCDSAPPSEIHVG